MGFIKIVNSLVKGFVDHMSAPLPPSPPSREERVEEAFNVIKNHSLSCRCGGLSVPLSFKGKVYRCVRCDKQFANVQYQLSGFKRIPVTIGPISDEKTARKHDKLNNIMNFYEDAVILIKEEDALKANK